MPAQGVSALGVADDVARFLCSQLQAPLLSKLATVVGNAQCLAASIRGRIPYLFSLSAPEAMSRCPQEGFVVFLTQRSHGTCFQIQPCLSSMEKGSSEYKKT